MTVTLNLPPHVEQLAEALARGMSLDELVRDVLLASQPPALAVEPSPEEWVRKFKVWTEAMPAMTFPFCRTKQ